MNHLLTGLLLDLLARSRRLQALVSENLHPQLHDHRQQALDWLTKEENQLTTLLADPTLLDPKIIQTHYTLYQEIADNIRSVESYLVVPISGYNAGDQFLHAILRRTLNDCGYPLPCPLITSATTEYYWASVKHNVIGVQVGELGTLLSWVDLFHELAHFLYLPYRDELLDDFDTQLRYHFESEKRRASQAGYSLDYHELIDAVHDQWRLDWLNELLSDLIATFLVGAPYGWGHIKVCSRWRSDPFYPGPNECEETVHPSDDARMQAILIMLRLLDLSEDAALLLASWQEYVALLNSQQPKDYDLCYNASLIELLAQYVHHGCQEIGLVPITEQQKSDAEINVPLLLNEAWKKFTADPSTYHTWEQQALKKLA